MRLVCESIGAWFRITRQMALANGGKKRRRLSYAQLTPPDSTRRSSRVGRYELGTRGTARRAMSVTILSTVLHNCTTNRILKGLQYVNDLRKVANFSFPRAFGASVSCEIARRLVSRNLSHWVMVWRCLRDIYLVILIKHLDSWQTNRWTGTGL